jgi:hypothetical protein
MLKRLFLAGALVCGLLATSAVASAESADARKFTGRTSQRYRIVMDVKGRSVKFLRFDIRVSCRRAPNLILAESGFLRTRVRNRGMFRDTQFGRTDTVRFRGRMTRKAVRGRIRVIDKPRKGVRCQSRWVKFRATPRR